MEVLDGTPSVVVQGALGDAWLVSALNILLTAPETLKKVLVSDRHRDKGDNGEDISHFQEFSRVMTQPAVWASDQEGPNIGFVCVSNIAGQNGLGGGWFGSVRFGSVRFGSVRFGSACIGSVRFDSGRVGSGRVGSGRVLYPTAATLC